MRNKRSPETIPRQDNFLIELKKGFPKLEIAGRKEGRHTS